MLPRINLTIPFARSHHRKVGIGALGFTISHSTGRSPPNIRWFMLPEVSNLPTEAGDFVARVGGLAGFINKGRSEQRGRSEEEFLVSGIRGNIHFTYE